MNIVDLFLNELQKRINSNEEIIHDFESRKNALLQIKNIFYNHNLLEQNLDLNGLLSLKNAEVKLLLNQFDTDKIEAIFHTYLVYKPIVLSYEELIKRFNSNFDAPQYQEAIKWLGDLVQKINNYINNFESRNEEYILKIKNENSFYKKYLNLFAGNVLIKPPHDLDEFNNLLDILSFGDYEKWQIKKEIGISLINISDERKKHVKIDSSKLADELNELYKVSDDKVDSVEDNFLIKEVEEILSDEKELIDNVDEKAFNAYLAQSINSNDSNTIKYQIVSILIALHNELEKYKNTLDIPKVNKTYEENIKEYVEVYRTLKGKIE